MPRVKSVVLSPAEKKAVITDIKNKIKAAKVTMKDITARRKAVDKVLAAAVKDHAAAQKALDKEEMANNKVIDTLQNQLAALTSSQTAQ